MASVWEELKRRNVVKVAVAYAIVGWLLIEVSTTVLPVFKAPEWIVQVFTFFILLGFPVALVLSWAYELTSDGLERTSSVPESKSIAKGTGKKLEYVIIGALALALIFVLSNDNLGDPDQEAVVEETAPIPETREERPAPVVVREQREVLPNSVAVLLCDNLSPNPDDAYFSASIHEEILNQLVKISSLNVIARTSVLQYADAGLTIPQIAAELNVGAVMECSVRFAGTAIMVTAQLIDPVTDSHLWSDTYPGDLSDLSAVFEMQADIAMNIANALQAEFSTAEQERLGKQVTVSAEAYNSYLRAIAAWRAGSPDTSDLLDSAIALDPDFAAAYAAKALHIAGQLFFGIDKTADRERLAIEYAETALSIDPDLAMAHVALAKVHELNWHRAEAEAAYKRVIQLYPRDASVAAAYATFNRAVLNYPEAIRLGRLAASLDPNRPSYWHQLGVTYLHARNDEAASVVLRNALALNPAFTPSIFELGAYQVSRGNMVAAQERFRTVDLTGQWNNVGFLRAMLALGYDRAGLHDDAERAFADVERLSTDNATGSASMAIAYLAIHDYDRAYDALERTINGPELLGLSPSIELKVNRWELPALEEPRFVELRNKLGFQD